MAHQRQSQNWGRSAAQGSAVKTTHSASQEQRSPVVGRLASLDAYRGFVMLAMITGGLGVATVAKNYPNSQGWQAAAYQLSHVEWGGCSFWDLIQPSFMFIVGVAMPFSYATRRDRGDSWGWIAFHALIRSLVLIALGVMLYSHDHHQTNFTFENVLAQIGLGYFFAFLLLELGAGVQVLAIVVALGLTWFLFFNHPLPSPDAGAELKVKGMWPHYTGFAAHWDAHTNFAADIDRRLLNSFPREGDPFIRNEGGYQTLNFLPSMATILIGVLTGTFLQSSWSRASKFGMLLLAGLLMLAAGLALDHSLWPTKLPLATDPKVVVDAGPDRPFASPTWTVGPAVKKIWTPTWAIFSAGWALAILSVFYGIIDGIGLKLWSLPFIVIGANSILIYLLNEFLGNTDHGWIITSLKRHFGDAWLQGRFEPMYAHLAVVGVLWLFCIWLYQQKLFFKI